MEEYESVLCVKHEVFVYRIPARTSNRGYRLVARLRVYVEFTSKIFLTIVIGLLMPFGPVTALGFSCSQMSDIKMYIRAK